jgi:hypothetical protein
MESSDHMCLGSDAMNVAVWAPFQSLWFVTSRHTLIPGVSGVPANERLSRLDALRHMTVSAAGSSTRRTESDRSSRAGTRT